VRMFTIDFGRRKTGALERGRPSAAPSPRTSPDPVV
jgi:hypothetical protein